MDKYSPLVKLRSSPEEWISFLLTSIQATKTFASNAAIALQNYCQPHTCFATGRGRWYTIGKPVCSMNHKTEEVQWHRLITGNFQRKTINEQKGTWDIQATGTRHFSPTAPRSSGNYMTKKIFRNPQAQRLLEKKASDSNVWEYGVDDIGQIYFAYANGVVVRYTRREFIKLAKDEEICFRLLITFSPTAPRLSGNTNE